MNGMAELDTWGKSRPSSPRSMSAPSTTPAVPMPPPRPTSPVRERSKTLTWCPACPNRRAAEQPAIDPPTIPTFNTAMRASVPHSWGSIRSLQSGGQVGRAPRRGQRTWALDAGHHVEEPRLAVIMDRT